jgi:hypothetical protein
LNFLNCKHDVHCVRPPNVVSLLAARVYCSFEGIMDFK